ncbi:MULTISPECIES: hypothetical protein [unclassified Streptomyces]|uniref:hypothetical protein n=1 Tax=unclassified Streptomyces TaxID=2593676 RepID=UPI002255A2C6|nr:MULTISPECIES: hypothetical protein [unclassified Streptomyces]WSP57139.1 hypothetical protein OG306_24245 [Streptomyces sp. NBC_01241]WSU22143.1 hypothetical protein OG508_14985 [Streptomyces sp. NBC_01108]MCX4788945.1 hypothetical protein [Streptomyces sp. NBC_01221]MCX4795310.1 hypothetical protein [Streptomyces sp. NBC_01242]WSJ36617.1 hypothetical protein OG772_11605 [Streptomyces sp. NBC_01321]
MSRGGEDEVRRMLDGPHPQVPAELAQRAAERGARLLRRRRFAGRLMLLLTCAAVVAFTVWAVAAQPWQVPPAETTPPLDGW